MSGDQVHAVSDLIAKQSVRIQELRRTSDRLQAIRDQMTRDLRAKRKDIRVLSARIDLLLKVGELFRALMDKLVLGQVHTVEGIVTEGLKTIFADQDLTLESDVGQRYNKVYIDFFLRQGLDEGWSVRGHPMESFGGGPTSVTSLIIRLMTLLKLKRWPVLLLDETLASVSDEYIDQTALFLQKLAASTKIDVLLVTHKSAFLEHANVAYQGTEELGEDGSWQLALKRLRGPK